ncbi:unnamed protein product [Rotaria sp. Silwood1]|nr:unnamed protein product [Rotaria sp. Silwood1]
MSTFLLALIVAPMSDFACRPDHLVGSENTKSRVCGRVDILPQLTYADEIAYKALEFFNIYFDIDYPLPKIEHFAVPDFGAGAMENYAMSQQTDLLANHDILLNVERYFLELVVPIYNTIGWVHIDQSTEWLRTLLQPKIVSAACRYGHQGCIEAARSAYRRWNLNPTLNQIPANLRSTVYCTVVHEGSQTEFNFLWARLQVESVASEIFNLLKGLSCTQDPSLILWFLDQHLKNGSVIRDQDSSSSIENVARSPRANQIAWNWIRDNWSQLFDRWGKSDTNLGDIIEAVSSRFVTIRQRDEFKTFADSIIDKAEKKDDLSYALEVATRNIREFEEQYQLAHQWFGNLVSPAWWDDLWLNEGFAKWMEFVGTNKIHPEWDLYQQFIAQRWLTVMQDDAVSLSHPVNMQITRNEQLANIVPTSLVFDLLSYASLERAYIVWERILAGLSYIEQMIASSSSDLTLYEQFQSYIIDLILPIYTQLGWQEQSSMVTDKWLDALHRDLIVSTACHYNLDDCVHRAQFLFEQWFNHPSNNSIEPNDRPVVYCTNVRIGGRAEFQFLLHQYRTSNDPQEKARIQSALACTRDTELIRYLLEIHGTVEFQAIIERIRANIQWTEKAKPNLEEWFMNRTVEIRLPFDWIPSQYALDFDVRLSATYPNNAEPNTLFMGRTRIIVRCNRSTNVFRIHMKQLQMSSITLRRLDTSKNLITDWTWIHDPSFTVVRSNGAMLDGGQPIQQSDGRLLSRFEQTPPMSTYLIAFVVTDFECVSNVTSTNIEVNICGRPEAIQKGEGNFALQVSTEVIPYYEQSYNISYPLSKCDHFALPDFAIGGMENWGLITYRETALLYNNVTGNLADKRRVGEVVSHELAHQWFGDIVTPQWWNDLW